MKTGTKLFLLIIAVCLVMCFYNMAKPKSSEPEKAIAALDYNKPIYTIDHAIICPQSLLNDRRADHDIGTVMNMYMRDSESEAEKLGCEVWMAGIEVVAKPIDGMSSLVSVNTDDFTTDVHLTNDPKGTMRSSNSSAAQPSSPAPSPQTQEEMFDNSKTYINTVPASPIPLSNGSGTVLVSTPSKVPILMGDVKAANIHGFGAVICPDSRSFAAFVDIPSQNSDQKSGQTSKKATSGIDTFRHYGCSYFPPDSPMVSDGGDPSSSLVSVKVDLHDGRTITGVTFSNWIVENKHQHEDAPQ